VLVHRLEKPTVPVESLIFHFPMFVAPLP
jgi:hypothetical protein